MDKCEKRIIITNRLIEAVNKESGIALSPELTAILLDWMKELAAGRLFDDKGK